MSGSARPEISVIIIAGPERERGANALASVLAQEEIERAEIILIDIELHNFPPIPGSDHPQVRLIQMGHELHVGALRTYAARVGRAPLLAYLEEHALALPGWLKGILARFERGEWVAVAGAVVPASLEVGLGKLVYMTTFARWLESSPSGEIDALPGYDTAYRRDVLFALEAAGEELELMMLVEMTLQKRLAELGYKFYFDNAIRWIHLNENQPGRFFINYFYWNIVFGRSRVAGRAPAHRILRIVTTPLILPVRMLKSMRQVIRYAGRKWPAYLRLIPHIFMMHLADVLGLGLGYVGAWKNVEIPLTLAEFAEGRELPPPAYDIWNARSDAEALHATR